LIKVPLIKGDLGGSKYVQLHTKLVLHPRLPEVTMKAIKVMATIDNQGPLCIDEPLKLLQNSRVEAIVLIPEVIEINEEEQRKEAILADFRQAWHEAMTGKMIPAVEIWEGIEDV